MSNEIENKFVTGVFGYGNFDNPYLIGIGTDRDEAIKILKKDCKKCDRKVRLIYMGKERFRKSTTTIESNESDYLLKKIKLNTLIDS